MKRRNLIKSLGIATTTAIGAQSVQGRSQKGQGPSNESVKNLIKKHSERGDVEKAFEILEKRGVPVKKNSVQPELENEEPSEEDGDIQPHNRYSESNSELIVYSWETSNSMGVTAFMDFDTLRTRVRSVTNSDDVIGITFNGDHYVLDDPPEFTAYGGDEPRDADYNWSAEPSDYSPNEGGAAARIDLGRPDDNLYPTDPGVVLTATFNSLTNEMPPIFCEYKHTYAYPYKGSLQSITLTPPTGGVELEFSTGASEAWSLGGWADMPPS